MEVLFPVSVSVKVVLWDKNATEAFRVTWLVLAVACLA